MRQHGEELVLAAVGLLHQGVKPGVLHGDGGPAHDFTEQGRIGLREAAGPAEEDQRAQLLFAGHQRADGHLFMVGRQFRPLGGRRGRGLRRTQLGRGQEGYFPREHGITHQRRHGGAQVALAFQQHRAH